MLKRFCEKSKSLTSFLHNLKLCDRNESKDFFNEILSDLKKQMNINVVNPLKSNISIAYTQPTGSSQINVLKIKEKDFIEGKAIERESQIIKICEIKENSLYSKLDIYEEVSEKPVKMRYVLRFFRFPDDKDTKQFCIKKISDKFKNNQGKDLIHDNILKYPKKLTRVSYPNHKLFCNDVCIVSEYCEQNLDTFIKSFKPSKEKAKEIMTQIVEGFSYLKQKNVPPEDLGEVLKPCNILLSGGTVKLDYLTFKSFFGSRSSSMYQAPEIRNGQPIDDYCYIWSLGTIYYELLHGRSPFDGAARVIIDSNFQPEISNQIDEKTKMILERMISFEKKGRMDWEKVVLEFRSQRAYSNSNHSTLVREEEKSNHNHALISVVPSIYGSISSCVWRADSDSGSNIDDGFETKVKVFFKELITKIKGMAESINFEQNKKTVLTYFLGKIYLVRSVQLLENPMEINKFRYILVNIHEIVSSLPENKDDIYRALQSFTTPSRIINKNEILDLLNDKVPTRGAKLFEELFKELLLEYYQKLKGWKESFGIEIEQRKNAELLINIIGIFLELKKQFNEGGLIERYEEYKKVAFPELDSDISTPFTSNTNNNFN